MRALRCNAYGPPEDLVVEELPDPVPGPGEALVEVRAASINFPDVLLLENRYQISATPPFTPGSELTGVVVAVGPGVQEVRPGDAVYTAMLVGAFAEKLCVPAAGLRRLPVDADFAEAAALPVAYGTAHHALRSVAQLAAGETLVVLGAAGGVGLAAVRLGVLQGARVIAAASSAAKLDVCRGCGAQAGIDYEREDLKQRMRELTAGRGVDVVLDPVGGDYAEAALRAIRWRGRFVSVGFASGRIPRIALNLVLLKGVTVLGFEFGAFTRNAPQEAARNTEELWDWFAAGELRPHISAVYPLDEAARGLRDVADRRTTGKVVVEPGR